MPVIQRPSSPQYVSLPARQALQAGEWDVVIVGGGPAGLGAAYGAAKAGARVALVERYGFLGGNATAALVMPLMSFHTQKVAHPQLQSDLSLLPSDHGEGKAAIAGALADFLAELVRAKGAIPPSLATGYVVPFDPEIFKGVALQWLDQLGVDFLFHSWASEVQLEADFEGRTKLSGVFLTSKSGPVFLKAHTVVDCTGDGDIAALAGCPFEIGREEDGLVQPMTLMFRMAGFAHADFAAYVEQHPKQWRGVHGLWQLVEKARQAGELDLAREDILMFATPHAEELSVNSTRVTRVLGSEVWDLSYAEFESRRQLQQIARFLQKYVPGFQSAYMVQSGVQVGVRESRRILGRAYLRADDLLTLKRFADVIAKGTYPIDIHNPTGAGTILRRIPAGESYDIPLGSLLPRECEHLLVAGRCISGSHEAHSSYRVMPISMATGQAAGVCAALAASRKLPPSQLPYQMVQAELRRQGAQLD